MRATIILERLGSDDAADLSRIYGGRRLSVPGNVTPPPTGGRHGFKHLEALFGYRLAVLLVLHFGPSRMYVPRAAKGQRPDPRKVKRLTARGYSASRIAERLGCSDRAVHAARRSYSS